MKSCGYTQIPSAVSSRHKQASETARCYPTHTGDKYAQTYSNTSTFRGFHKANKAKSIRVVLALIKGLILNIYYMQNV